jgi:hypothetical protein
MIFADLPGEIGATFVQRAAGEDVTGQHRVRAAGIMLGEIEGEFLDVGMDCAHRPQV